MEINENTLSSFREDVNYFAEIDSQIKETEQIIKPLKTRLKELKDKKKEIEQDICETLKKNNLKNAESSDNGIILVYQEKKAVVPVNQKIIKDKLFDFFQYGPGSKLSFHSKNTRDKADEIFDFLYSKENRDYKTVNKIKVEELKN